METSSAVVGSSAMTEVAAPQHNARAITTRWRMPPEKLVGVVASFAPLGLEGIPDLPCSRSPSRLLARRLAW